MTFPAEHPTAIGTLKKLIAIGLVCLLAGLVARHFLWGLGDESNFDPTPLPTSRLNAPFITSPDLVVEKMVELAELTEEDLVYDLGCGDGRLVITAALRSGCRGVGFDNMPELVAKSRENAQLNGVDDRVTIEERDIFKVDLGKADAALLYLLPWMMNELLPQFDQMKPGARIVSHAFWIEGVEPDKVVEVPIDENLNVKVIYVYKTPLKKNPGMQRGKPPQPVR